MGDVEAKQLRSQLLRQVRTQSVQSLIHKTSRLNWTDQRSIVPVRRIFFCKRSTP